MNATLITGLLAFTVKDLPIVNASLNSLATVMLIVGFVLIKRRQEAAHKAVMISALGVSIAFLACYLVYHEAVGHVAFSGPENVRTVYYVILWTHIPLAVTVPPLALTTIYFGLRDHRERHRKWARRTFPIWLYVSVTGVIIYLMLYQIWGGPPEMPPHP